MSDPGQPTSYLALAKGTPVVTSDGARLGTVHEVLADADADVFDGIVVDVGHARRFVDAPEVASLHEHEVLLSIDAATAERLPEPSGNPAVMDADPADGRGRGLLRRAWDRLSGNY